MVNLMIFLSAHTQPKFKQKDMEYEHDIVEIDYEGPNMLMVGYKHNLANYWQDTNTW